MRHPTLLYYLDDGAGFLSVTARRLRLRLPLAQRLFVCQLVLARLQDPGGVPRSELGAGPHATTLTLAQRTDGRHRR